METLFTILCIVFILALLVGAYAHDKHNLFLEAVVNVIMVFCLATFVIVAVVWYFIYLIQLLWIQYL